MDVEDHYFCGEKCLNGHNLMLEHDTVERTVEEHDFDKTAVAGLAAARRRSGQLPGGVWLLINQVERERAPVCTHTGGERGARRPGGQQSPGASPGLHLTSTF